jgi:hypothetical protein
MKRSVRSLSGAPLATWESSMIFQAEGETS